ncbi:MAG: Glutathione-regulated potassium-efflux system ancillary protein KefF [Labilithrix sp.]|nr:Glutathione-regulated potassium-efflux system ancillary protein KefF [Labilithrix sp.]
MTSPGTILLLHAHPYPRRSRANRALLRAVEDLPGLSVRSLYDRYPDFAIDVDEEKAALLEAKVIVWQCPFYWYGVPSLMQHWFEKVLEHGWAYGHGGDALSGKRVFWVTTTGSDASGYQPDGMHSHPFHLFITPIEQTARFCGMDWEEPLIVHGAHKIGDLELERYGRTYRQRLETLRDHHGHTHHG